MAHDVAMVRISDAADAGHYGTILQEAAQSCSKRFGNTKNHLIIIVQSLNL